MGAVKRELMNVEDAELTKKDLEKQINWWKEMEEGSEKEINKIKIESDELISKFSKLKEFAHENRISLEEKLISHEFNALTDGIIL